MPDTNPNAPTMPAAIPDRLSAAAGSVQTIAAVLAEMAASAEGAEPLQRGAMARLLRALDVDLTAAAGEIEAAVRAMPCGPAGEPMLDPDELGLDYPAYELAIGEEIAAASPDDFVTDVRERALARVAAMLQRRRKRAEDGKRAAARH